MKLQEFHDTIWWPRCTAKLREITQESYHCAWKNWIEPTLGTTDLNDITPRLLDAWLAEKHVTPNAWRVCKAMIRCAYKYELIDTDPCTRILNVPTRGTPTHVTLTKQEMITLMDGLKGTPVYSPVVCSCTMGLRREESCGLKWEDFDWNASTVRIERGVQFINGREIYVDPKTHLSRRTLPLPQETIERLYSIRGEGRITGNLHVHQVATHLRTLCKQNNLPYVPMSNLRTSWCTLMINEGMPVSKVSRYMGHSDVETTMRWYTRTREDELKELTSAWSGNGEEVVAEKPSSRRSVEPVVHASSSSRSHVTHAPKPTIDTKHRLFGKLRHSFIKY